ncbi:transposase [Streptococcus pneumoniae]|nr:transposase [Streptococcus pneumoniae]
MQDNYTTKGKHLTIDSRRLIERWKKEGKSNREIASLLGKLLKLSTLKSSVGQSDNVLEKGASKRFILPTTLNSLKKLKEKILHYT